MISGNESFVRWQNITITQLGYTINLILALTIAVLGFLVSFMLNKDFVSVLVLWQKYLFLIALLSLGVSFILGILCIVSRLCDFRMTTKIARKRENAVNKEELEHYRIQSRELGQKTWHLFWWQIGTFAIGVICTALGIFFLIYTKLALITQ
jgi:hypothetical protein